MGALIIWMDTEKAKIFRLDAKGVSREVLRDHGPNHPVESQGVNHPVHQTDEERFYRSLASQLQGEDSTEWLLMGPGLAKEHFSKHLQKFHPDMSRKVVGRQKSEALSDPQILEKGHHFFHRFNLFRGLF